MMFRAARQENWLRVCKSVADLCIKHFLITTRSATDKASPSLVWKSSEVHISASSLCQSHDLRVPKRIRLLYTLWGCDSIRSCGCSVWIQQTIEKKQKSLWNGSPCYKRLVTGWFVDCLRLYPQSCVKVRSDPAAAGWGFPASVPPGPCDHWHHGDYCCWGTCSSPVRQRGCSLPPACGEAACWTRLGRTKAAAWRRGALRPPRSGSPKWHLSRTNGSLISHSLLEGFINKNNHLRQLWQSWYNSVIISKDIKLKK